MIKRYSGNVMKTLIVLSIVVVSLIVWQILLKQKFENAYDKTQVGDSIDGVTTLFGKPSKVEVCLKPTPSGPTGIDYSYLYSNCSTRYWYYYALSYMDLGAWLIEFDETGKVLRKDFVASQ
jgi:hypothetical protein